MADSALVSMSRIEGETSSIITGEVARFDRVTGLMDVIIAGTEYTGIQVHYHCQDGEKTQGYKAFAAEDIILLKDTDPNGGLASENLLVIGFADGYPRKCRSRMILFSATGGEYSSDDSISIHVVWDVDAEEIVIGPCSLNDLYAAGFLANVSPPIIAGPTLEATAIMDYIEYRYPGSAAAGCSCSDGSIYYLDDLAMYYIWPGDDVPDWNGSCSCAADTVDMTEHELMHNDDSEDTLSGYYDYELTVTLNFGEFTGNMLGYTDETKPEQVLQSYSFDLGIDSQSMDAKELVKIFKVADDEVFASTFHVDTYNSSYSKTVVGETYYLSTGDYFEIDRYDAHEVITESGSAEKVVNFYSPIAKLTSITLSTNWNSTVDYVKWTDTTTSTNNTTTQTYEVEIVAFSGASESEEVEDDGNIFYEKICVVGYVLTGEISNLMGGVETGTEDISPAVNVSIDVVDSDDFDDFDFFSSENIETLQGALESALVNSSGGTNISVNFFRGIIT